MSTTPHIAFLASTSANAQQALEAMVARHGQHPVEEADVICAPAAMASCCRRCTGMAVPASRSTA